MSKHRKEKDNFACQLYFYINLSRLWSRAFIGKRFKSRSLRLRVYSVNFILNACFDILWRQIYLLNAAKSIFIYTLLYLSCSISGCIFAPSFRRSTLLEEIIAQRCISSMYWVRWDERIATIAFLNVVEQNEHTVQIATPFKLKVNSWRQAAADDSQLTRLKSFSRAKKRLAFLI